MAPIHPNEQVREWIQNNPRTLFITMLKDADNENDPALREILYKGLHDYVLPFLHQPRTGSSLLEFEILGANASLPATQTPALPSSTTSSQYLPPPPPPKPLSVSSSGTVIYDSFGSEPPSKSLKSKSSKSKSSSSKSHKRKHDSSPDPLTSKKKKFVLAMDEELNLSKPDSYIILPPPQTSSLPPPSDSGNSQSQNPPPPPNDPPIVNLNPISGNTSPRDSTPTSSSLPISDGTPNPSSSPLRVPTPPPSPPTKTPSPPQSPLPPTHKTPPPSTTDITSYPSPAKQHIDLDSDEDALPIAEVARRKAMKKAPIVMGTAEENVVSTLLRQSSEQG